MDTSDRTTDMITIEKHDKLKNIINQTTDLENDTSIEDAMFIVKISKIKYISGALVTFLKTQIPPIEDTTKKKKKKEKGIT